MSQVASTGNPMERFEEWDMTIPPLPSRSRLYCLEPIGIGSPYTESLTSYIIRLAEEHHVSLKILVMQEILPLLVKSNLSDENPHIHALWYRDALVLNGTSSYAKAWGDALARLTLWDNFFPLTMLVWRDVISRKGLRRPTQAWCPACYEEWREINSHVYNPLLWALKIVEVCPLHYIFLQTRCPYEDCRRLLPYFSPRARLGYCSYCMRWLGSSYQIRTSNCSDEVPIEDISQQYWVSKSVGELIEVAPNLSVPPNKDQIALSLTQCSNQLADGSLKLLARQLEIPYATLLAWQQGANTPRLDTILKACYTIGISVRSFLVETVYDWLQHSNIRPIRRNRHKDVAKEDICRTLEGFLSENPPLSLKEITAKLGYNSPTHLYRCSPELCSALTARYREWHQGSSVSRSSRQLLESGEDVRKRLEEILMSDEYPLPSIRQIGKRLGYRDGTTLHQRFPELCKAIFEKRRQQLLEDPIKQKLEDILSSDSYPPLSLSEVARNLGYPAEHLYNRFPTECKAIVKRHNQLFDVEALRAMLEAVLSADIIPPPPIRELAKQYGFGEARLRRHFPDFCAEIVEKYHAYRKNLRAIRIQHIYEDVKDRVLCLHAQGCYPSLRKVRELLLDKKYWIKDVNDAWRKVMLELHLDDHGEPGL
jgi:TniQ